MKTLLLLLTLAYPSLATAQQCNPADAPPGYTWQCSNGTCRLVRLSQIAFRPTIAALPHEYVTFQVEPEGAGSPFRFASMQTAIADQSFPAVSYATPWRETVTAVQSGTICDCSRTGICTCDPATCMCAACANGSVRMGLYSPMTMTYSASYAPMATSMFSLPADHTTRQHRKFDRLNRRAVRYGLQ